VAQVAQVVTTGDQEETVDREATVTADRDRDVLLSSRTDLLWAAWDSQ